MHGHAHHNHARNVEEPEGGNIEERGIIEERGDVVIVYKTVDPDFTGEVGGYVTGTEHTTATEARAGVGAPVAPTRTKEQTTETKATDEVTTTKTKEEPTTTKETVAHTTH